MKPGFEKVIKEALEAVNYKGSNDNERLRAAILDFSDAFRDEGAYVASVADDAFLQICSKAVECTSDQIEIIKENASAVLQNSRFHTGKEYSDQISNCVVDGFILYASNSMSEEDNKVEVSNKKKHSTEKKEQSPIGEPAQETDKSTIIENETRVDAEKSTMSEQVKETDADSDVNSATETHKKKKNRIKLAAIIVIAAIIGVIILVALSHTESQATLVENEATIAVDNNYTVKTDVVDYDELKWDISDTTVLDDSVDDKDKLGQIIVKGLSEGDADVTVYADGKEIGTCKIHVVVPEILFSDFKESILAEEDDDDYTDNIPIIIAKKGSTDTIYIDGNDSPKTEWMSTNEKVLKLSNKTGAETTCEVMGYGFTTIKATMNGKEISKKIVVSKKGSKEVLVDRDSLSISDDANVLLYCNYEANNDVVFAAEFTDIMDITWPEDKEQGMTVLNVKKTGVGKGTIEIDLLDENNNSVEGSKPAIISVTCE